MLLLFLFNNKIVYNNKDNNKDIIYIERFIIK
jgi:hypothetical protein